MSDDSFPERFLQEAYTAVSFFPERATCRQAVRLVAENTGTDRQTARRAINRLVTAGRLRYVNDCGVSYLEKSYIGCHRISSHVLVSTIITAEERPAGEPRSVIVRLMPGAAFGDCRHPTTRLSIRALDTVIHGNGLLSDFTSALDIGTGSGILAVTAARLGVKRVIATDIDACARKEARDNIAINGLDNAVLVCDMPIPDQPENFSIVMANLRPPTLKRLAALISEKTTDSSTVILSGMKNEETGSVLDAYGKDFLCVRKEEDAGWCGLILNKKRGGI